MSEKAVVIDGETYKIAHWPGEKSFLMLMRLGKALGEPMALMFHAAAKEETEPAVAMELAGQALRHVFSNSSPAEALALAKDCLEYTFVGATGVATDFSTRYAGKMGHLMKVLQQTVSYQYLDFTGALLEVVRAGKKGAV